MTAPNCEVNQLLSTIPDYIQKVHCDTNELTEPFKCAVMSCPNLFLSIKNHTKQPYKFHQFPINKKLRKLWKLKCGWGKYDYIKGMVCSNHFQLDDYIRNYKEEFTNPSFKRLLRPEAVPNIKLGPNENKEFDVSDDDYDTDPECSSSVLQNVNQILVSQSKPIILKKTAVVFPKEYHCLTEDVEMQEEPLDLNEIKSEVDLNLVLEKQNAELQNEAVDYERKIKDLNKKINSFKARVNRVKKKYDVEVEILKKIFSQAQIDLLMGKKTYWTDNDLATAFTIRHMGSKKCYLYMKNTLKLPLPALSCIQKWAATCAQKKPIRK